jgi:hypothetical protein
VLDLLPPDEFAAGQRASLDLIRELNLRHRETRGGATELDARIASYELAYRMQSAALEVGGLDKELPTVRASYGLEHEDKRTRAFGRKCPARAAARRTRRPLRATLRHARQGRLGRAREDHRQSRPARPLDRSAHRRIAQPI